MEIELAIFEDCLNLIDKFVESNNPSFKTFCEKWHLTMFHHVYAVQTSVIEIIQTTKTILHLAKRIVCAKDELGKLALEGDENARIYRRFGGIYLMYAIYFKQPTDRYVKVQMSNETWQAMKNFIEGLPVNNITDEVRFIFWSLYKEDAFRFTACDYDLGLENLVEYDRLYDIYHGNKYVDIVRVKLKQKLTAVAETEKILPNLIALEEQYNNSKQSLSTDKSTKHLPATKIFQDMQDAIKSIHIILDEDNQQETTACKNNEIRREIKRKAAGYKTNDEESPSEDNSQQGEVKKRCGKPTVRQLMTQELPEFITDDLKDNSTDDEN